MFDQWRRHRSSWSGFLRTTFRPRKVGESCDRSPFGCLVSVFTLMMCCNAMLRSGHVTLLVKVRLYLARSFEAHTQAMLSPDHLKKGGSAAVDEQEERRRRRRRRRKRTTKSKFSCSISSTVRSHRTLGLYFT